MDHVLRNLPFLTGGRLAGSHRELHAFMLRGISVVVESLDLFCQHRVLHLPGDAQLFVMGPAGRQYIDNDYLLGRMLNSVRSGWANDRRRKCDDNVLVQLIHLQQYQE